MILATWNINSVKARTDRLLAWLDRARPDVVCLQELKVVDDQFPALEVRARGYHIETFGQRTYNGVAILSLSEPRDVLRGMDDEADDPQARLISATIDGVRVISAYFPNGGAMNSDKYEYKLAWMKRLRAHLDARHDPKKDSVALCGDFNVAPFDDDIARPEEWGETVLTSPTVREALQDVQDFGFTDVFRPFHPEGHVYTWWDYRGLGFERGNGLRIDHVFVTAPLADRCIGAVVDREERKGKGASDHAPVLVELDLEA